MGCLYYQCVVVVALISYALSFTRVVYGQPQVRCIFVFGDSLADTGNNNDLKTAAKANFPPYGVDFRSGPTGRFTNGRNYADIVGDLLGFTDYPPTYVTSEGKNVRTGVNYASGGSGILPETGKILGEVFSFDAQLSNHKITLSRINSASKGNEQNNALYLNKCIYLVGFGSNDYINNYLMHPNQPDEFADNLIRQYSTQLTTLYNYGARKIALFGLSQIGCIPAVLSMAPKSASGCVDTANLAVNEFNNRLKPLVDQLNNELKGANFVYVNITHILMADPGLNGIKTPDPCCKVSSTTGMCVSKQAPCSDRGTHSFFDSFHPTEKSFIPVANRAYKAATPLDVYPMDIFRLTQLP